MMTGEPEIRIEQERAKSGIPLTVDVVESIEREAAKVSLKWDDYL